MKKTAKKKAAKKANKKTTVDKASVPMYSKKYLAEDAARTLIRAAEIRQNKSLLSAAMKEVMKQQRAINSIKK
jgi:hypothetical protein